MFEGIELSKSRAISSNPLHLEAEAIEQGDRRSTLVLQPQDSGSRELQLAEVRGTNLPSTGDLFRQGLADVLRDMRSRYERFKDSPTYRTRLASLLILSGSAEQATQHLREAAERAKLPSRWLRLSENLLSIGQEQEAHDLLEQFASGGSVEAQLRLAELAINRNELSRAANHVKAALEIDPIDWRTQLLAGTLALGQREPRAALQHYREALKDKPNSAALYLNMAIAHYATGNQAKALLEVRKSLGINPWYKNALEFYAILCTKEGKQLDQAAGYLSRYLEYAERDAAIIRSLSDIYYCKGEHKQAISLLESVDEDDLDATMLNNLGVLSVNKRPEVAGRYFSMAVSKVGDIRKIHSNRGASIGLINLSAYLLKENRASEADELAGRFIDGASDQRFLSDEVLSKVVGLRIHALTALQKYDLARETASKFSLDNSVFKETRVELAMSETLLLHYIWRRTNEALRFAKLAADLAQDREFVNPRLRCHAFNNLAFLLIESHLLEDAKYILPQLDSTRTDNEFVIATKGLYAFRTGHPNRGATLYRKAIGRAPDPKRKMLLQIKLEIELGRSFADQGDTRKAQRHFRKALKYKASRAASHSWIVEGLQREAKLLLGLGAD